MGSYGRKYSREERARMIQNEGDGLADQFRERIAALEADLAAARAALEAVEWIVADSNWEWCAFCHATREDGHKPDCPRQVALGLAKKP